MFRVVPVCDRRIDRFGGLALVILDLDLDGVGQTGEDGLCRVAGIVARLRDVQDGVARHVGRDGRFFDAGGAAGVEHGIVAIHLEGLRAVAGDDRQAALAERVVQGVGGLLDEGAVHELEVIAIGDGGSHALILAVISLAARLFRCFEAIQVSGDVFAAQAECEVTNA